MKDWHIIAALVFCLFSSGLSLAADDGFTEKLSSLTWVAYAPTDFNPEINKYPDAASLEEDLRVLRGAGFSGVITYGSQDTLADIPSLARRLGFEGVIMGIWGISDRQELENAFAAAPYVDGYCVGNEGLQYKRYTIEELRRAIAHVKEQTGKPAATTEPVTAYSYKEVIELGDWIFPNAHPFLRNIKHPLEAAEWIKKYQRIVRTNASWLKKPILFKEVGFPTDGDTYGTQENQRVFFKLLEMEGIKFAYFEAFDQYWKRWLPVEPHWGLFDKYRAPKRFISERVRSEEEDAAP